jgi:polar amino acid transport system substrate-binding protein
MKADNFLGPALRSGLLASLLTAAALLQGCAQAPQSAAPGQPTSPPVASLADVRKALAPSGKLRVAVYPGSPTSLVRSAPSAEMRGLTVDIGRELALRLGVPAEIVVFDRVALVIEAIKAGRADMTITNATPERAADLDFTEALVALELGVLVGTASPLKSVDAMDSAGLRIGVSQGSSSQRVLGGRFKLSTLVPVSSLSVAASMLKAQELDGFATNKGVLFELGDGVPGAQVLPGAWGQENLALAVVKAADGSPGTSGVRAWLRAFTIAMRNEGRVQAAAARAGLRGLAPVAAR